MATEFGRDISCTTGLRTGRFSTGPRLVGEAMFRRFTTPRFALRGGEDEANYGLDLLDLIGSVSNAAAVAALPGRIQAEARKDERVEKATATVTSTTEGPSTSWSISIACDTADGPFSLNIGIKDLTISLLGLEVGS